MTTFTTEDRINASPPHIVDSGASVMKMTANKLADELELFWLTKNDDLLAKAVVMLRQQQDRIGALEANLDITNKAYRVQQRYIAELEKGLDSSVNLNKAQALRKAQEK
jgi:hypothetical protein